MSDQNLSDLINNEVRTVSAERSVVRTKITDDVILNSEIEKIREAKASGESDYIAQLKEGLASQDEYIEKVDSGDLSFIGVDKPEDAPTILTEPDDEDDEPVIITNSEENFKSPVNVPSIDFSEFVPDYDDESVESDEKKEEETETVPDKIYANLPIQRMEHDTSLDAARILVRDTKDGRIEFVKREKDTVMSDKSFLTALNKIKKTAFSTTTLPLVNSGFFITAQGGGIVDILQLYKDKIADTTAIEYDLARTKTFIKAVKSTEPMVDPVSLASSIHESDYQLLALAYASSTLKNFTIPHTCEKCRENFKIELPPIDSIKNIDKINEKVMRIREAKSVNDVSLLAEDIKITTARGAVVVLGHPSFMDYLHRIDCIKSVAEMDQSEGQKFAANLKMVSLIRRIELPNGVKTANAYQVFKALSLLDEDDFSLIDDKMKEMEKDIIIPEFGIKSVTCPVCGEVNRDIEIGNIDDMVFFHIMVTQV